MRGESTAVRRVIPLTLTLVQRGRGESFLDTVRQAGCACPMDSGDLWVKGRGSLTEVFRHADRVHPDRPLIRASRGF